MAGQRYLGGKAKIARALSAAVLERARGRRIWEPFVGGANMTPYLRPEVASDVHAPLIAMYHAVVHAGWRPPSEITREQYEFARSLPDDDPLKAFAGYGASFGRQMVWRVHAERDAY